MKNILKVIFVIIGLILFLWGGLTIWVQRTGGKKISWLGFEKEKTTPVLIVYDPDPIYNLDEQVCQAFGNGLVSQEFSVTIATVESARQIPLDSFELYVFCANTYNWAPDWAVTDFIKENTIRNKSIVAITVGSGSTQEAQESLEALIKSQQGVLVDSRSFWLMRPNEERRMKESNTEVACSMAFQWAVLLSKKLR
jgi:hypothetical protein